MTFIGSTDFLIEVQKGNVPGHSIVHKFGRNPDIDLGFEAIWNGGGDYTGFDATAAEAIEVFSSSANDAGSLVSSGTATGGSTTTLVDSGATFVSDGVAVGDLAINDTQEKHGVVSVVTSETTLTVRRMTGSVANASGDTYRIATTTSTGIGVVKLNKLVDANYAEHEEYVILNGVTGVDTSGTYIRSSRVRCIIAGATGSNVGSITTRQTTTVANIFGIVPIGYNRTMIACYTIPAGKKGYLLAWYVSLSKKKDALSNVRLLGRAIGETFQVKEELTIASSGSSYVLRTYQGPKDGSDFCPMTDIKIMADSSVADNGIAAGFDLLLIDEDALPAP